MTAASATPDPRKIVDLDSYLTILVTDIEKKHRQIEEAQRQRIARQPLRTPLWRLREQLSLLVERFDLAIAEHESRHI